MSNVNKVKLLSERTSGVPAVIFYKIHSIPTISITLLKAWFYVNLEGDIIGLMAREMTRSTCPGNFLVVILREGKGARDFGRKIPLPFRSEHTSPAKTHKPQKVVNWCHEITAAYVIISYLDVEFGQEQVVCISFKFLRVICIALSMTQR